MQTTFANRLTQLRKSAGISQKEAAASLGISQALLSHYEKGIRECGLNFITRASEYYGVTCDYLLGKSSCPKGFTEGFFSVEEIPEDRELSSMTVFRASTIMMSQLRQSAAPHDDRYVKYFALCMYRLLIAGINAGKLPTDWLDGKTPHESAIYRECLIGLANVMLAVEPAESRAEGRPTPTCIKTVVKELEKFMIEQIETLAPYLEDLTSA